MLDNFNNSKFKFNHNGLVGLPENFPIPKEEGLLFYIQRNLNKNTVVYTINKNQDGSINQTKPILAYWLNYESGRRRKTLNQIQDKLAYGYNSWKINSETFQFQIVSYKNKDFFLAKDDEGCYRVFSKLNDEMSVISNIYVYAEEFGVFPQVKFIEFFGVNVDNAFPIYQKVQL